MFCPPSSSTGKLSNKAAPRSQRPDSRQDSLKGPCVASQQLLRRKGSLLDVGFHFGLFGFVPLVSTFQTVFQSTRK